MARYESKVKEVNALQQNVYNRLSDLSQLQVMKDNMPPELKETIKAKLQEQGQGKIEISNVHFDRDSAHLTVNGMPAAVKIIEREEPKCVKYSADNSPIDFTIWIQMLPQAAYQTKIKVTVDVDIPFFLRPMVGNKLESVAEQIAEALTRIPY
ncbi:MAG: SRPBCC family protein [Bacteroidales bacterium]|nr:SRPBCC family protein [Candidatus Liminaster caballi]